MTQKDAALYYNVNVYIMFFLKMSFSNHFTYLKSFFCNEMHWLHCLKSFLVLHTHYIHFKIHQMFPQYTKNIVV